jgi:hypothetical protein
LFLRRDGRVMVRVLVVGRRLKDVLLRWVRS